MSTIRRAQPHDLLRMNLTNLDALTENYDLNFYLTYLMKWPSLFNVIEEKGQIVGYIMGKLEEQPASHRASPHYTPWHGHITVLTVAPQYRRLGFARRLTESLEKACDEQNAWFVDLFVRKSNTIAREMYEGMGYTVYRVVVGYYSDDPRGGEDGEDALDMRKPLSRDKEKKWVRSSEEGEKEENQVDPEDVY